MGAFVHFITVLLKEEYLLKGEDNDSWVQLIVRLTGDWTLSAELAEAIVFEHGGPVGRTSFVKTIGVFCDKEDAMVVALSTAKIYGADVSLGRGSL